MTDRTAESSRDERVNLVLADYLREAERGSAPTHHELLARHPDLAADLTAFLDDRNAVLRVAAPLMAAVPSDATFPGRAADTLDTPDGFGDYEHLEEIGRGAFGVVYRARQVSANRDVALKMILAGRFASDADVRRFRREAEMAAQLDHPNIVPIYEVGQHDGRPFFSMKLVEGGPLSEHLDRFRGDPRAAARLVAQLARAVHHAHQRGLLHRDLKPGNVLLSSGDGGEPVPLVTDFGLARWIESDGGLTQSGAVVGTPEHMAPEQACGQRSLTTAVDVYGLGTILYVLLTGRPPFRSALVLETLRQVVDAEPARPRSVAAGVPADMELICLKCLEKSPARRYGSAEALAEDLERWLNGEPIAARSTGRLERLRLWARRNPVVAALASGVAVLAVALTALAAGAAVHFARLNTSLTEETAEAKRAREEEGRQRHAATVSADLAQQRLGRMYVENGVRALDHDPGAALLWFAEALRWDGDEPKRAAVHRSRVTAFLEDWPLPEGEFPLPRPGDAEFLVSPDGRYIAVHAIPPRGTPARSNNPPSDSHVVEVRTGRVVIDGRSDDGADAPPRGAPGRFAGRAPAWFSADGRRFVGLRGGKVYVWDLESGKPLAGPLDRSVLRSDDGRWLLASSRDRLNGPVVAGYDLSTGRRAWELEAEVEGNLSGRFLGRDRNGRLRVFETATGAPLGPGVAAPAGASVRLLSDRGPLWVGSATAGDRLFDPVSGQRLFPAEDASGEVVFRGRPDATHFLAYREFMREPRVAVAAITASPQGPAALAAAVAAATLARAPGTAYVGRMHHTATGKPAGPTFAWTSQPARWRGVVSRWDLTADGTLVLYHGRHDGSDGLGTIETLAAFAGRRVASVPAAENGWNVLNTVISPNGRWLVVLGERRDGEWPRPLHYSARILELPSLREVRPTVALGTGLPSPLWSPDGRSLVLVSGELPPGGDAEGRGERGVAHLVQLIAPRAREGVAEPAVARFPERITSSRLSPDGRYLLVECADGTLHLRRLPRLDGGTSLVGTGPVAFSPDGTRLVTRFGARGLLHDLTRLSDFADEAPPQNGSYWLSVKGTTRFAWVQAGPMSAGVKLSVKDAATGRNLWTTADEVPLRGTPRFTPDGRLLLGLEKTVGEWRLGETSDRFDLRAWDAATGQPLAYPERPPLRPARPVRMAGARGADNFEFAHEGDRVVDAAGRSVILRTDGTCEWTVSAERPAAGRGRAGGWPGVPGPPVTAVRRYRGVLDLGQVPVSAPRGLRQYEHAVLTANGAEARVLRADSGEPFGPMLRHSGPVRMGLIDRDGRNSVTVLLVGADGGARLYDGATGEPAGPLFRHGRAEVQTMAVPGQAEFLTSAGEEVLAWRRGAEPTRLPNAAGPVTVLTPVPASRAVLVSGSKGAWLYRTDAAGPLLPPPGRGADVSPDAGIAELRGRTARFWDPVSGKPLTPPLEHEEDVVFALRRRGLFVWTATASGHRFWTEDGRPAGPVQKHPDGARVVEAGSTGGGVWLREARGDFFLWALPILEERFRNPAGPPPGRGRPGGPVQPHRIAGGVSDFFCSPDGRWLVLAETTGDAWLHDLATGRRVVAEPFRTVHGGPRGARFSLRPKPTGPDAPPPSLSATEPFGGVAFAPGAARLATVTRAGEVQVRAGDTAAVRYTLPREGMAWTAARFSRDGRYLLTIASTGADPRVAGPARTVCVWDAQSGKPRTPLLEAVAAPCFMPDGEHILIPGQPGKTLWSLKTGSEAPIPEGHDPVGEEGLESPDGRFVAVPVETPVNARARPGNRGVRPPVEGGVRVRERATGRLLTPPLPGDAVAFSADGLLLLCGTQVFESVTGLPVTPPVADAPEASVLARFTPDGAAVLTGVNGVARLRSLRSDRSVEALRSLARRATGRRIDDGGAVRQLTAEEWAAEREPVGTAPDADTVARAAGGAEAARDQGGGTR